jgi:hypothetical protein
MNVLIYCSRRCIVAEARLFYLLSYNCISLKIIKNGGIIKEQEFEQKQEIETLVSINIQSHQDCETLLRDLP